jgi:hypothetical protein
LDDLSGALLDEQIDLEIEMIPAVGDHPLGVRGAEPLFTIPRPSATLRDREPLKDQAMEFFGSEELDVIIVGAGNAATCAALSARENGARILMLEIAPEEARGGNSAFTGGAFRVVYHGGELMKALHARAAHDGITVLYETAAIGLLQGDRGIEGVRVRHRGRPTPATESRRVDAESGKAAATFTAIAGCLSPWQKEPSTYGRAVRARALTDPWRWPQALMRSKRTSPASDARRPRSVPASCPEAIHRCRGSSRSNRHYVERRAAWGIFRDEVTPVARSNVCSEIDPPATPSFYAFSYTVPSGHRRDAQLCRAGSGEAREGPPAEHPAAGIRPIPRPTISHHQNVIPSLRAGASAELSRPNAGGIKMEPVL